MNTHRQTKLSKLFNQLKHVIHADENVTVRRRNLLSSRQGDIQLELDLGDLRGEFSRRSWLALKAEVPPVVH